MNAVHPREHFFYKTGCAFCVILALSVIAVWVAAYFLHGPTSTVRLLYQVMLASFFLAAVSYLIDHVKYGRWLWAFVDGLLAILAAYWIVIFTLRNGH